MVNDPLQLFVQRLMIQNKSRTTIENYAIVVKEFLNFIGKKDRYTKEDVLAFLSYLQNKPKEKGNFSSENPGGTYLRFVYYVLKSLWRNMGWEWELDKSDVPKKNEPRRPFYTMEEIKKILDAAKQHASLRDYVALRVLVLSFSRRLSISRLTVHDYDPEKGTLKLPSIKGGRSIVLELDRETNDAMLEYLGRRRDLYPALFPSLRSRSEQGSLSPEYFNILLKKLCQIAGVENKGMHAFRRGLVTYMYSKGKREKEIQAMGDWRSPFMVHEYVQLSSEYANEGRKEVHPFFVSEEAKRYVPKKPSVRVVRKSNSDVLGM
jgi:integrase